DRDSVRDLRQRLQQALRQFPDFGQLRHSVDFTVTGEGLRIDLMENEQGLFFVSGSAEPSDAGRRLLGLLAAEVTRIPNKVVIEGHTDARPFRNGQPTSGYGNWELSTDRAHAARRLMIESGLPEGQVMEVRGFADRRLLMANEPDAARNRRISIVVRFREE